MLFLFTPLRTAGRLAAATLLVVAFVSPGAGAAPADDAGEPWQPKPPEGLPTDFDWIRLPSDEWLKGELVSMYDDELEFDSDELDDQSFDFEDIKEIRTSRVVQVGFERREPVVGRMLMVGDSVTVFGDAGEIRFDRSEILTIVVGKPKEINYWSGYADFGGTIRSGNTDQIDYSARAGLMRRSVWNRISVDYTGNITRIDSEDTSNNHHATLGWDRFITKRLYINVIGADWYRDPFQNIADRWTLTAGVGYTVVDTKRTTWDVQAGPAWQYTRFESVEPGEDDTSSSPALAIATNLEVEITKSIDYYLRYTAIFTKEQAGTYIHHLDTGLEIDLVGDLDVNISWVWDRIQDPRPLEDGTVPEPDDYRLIVGLGWDF